jgi:hypothetical protein
MFQTGQVSLSVETIFPYFVIVVVFVVKYSA